MTEQSMALYPGYFQAALMLAVLLPLFSFSVSLLISDRYAWSVSILGPFLMLISTVCSFIVLFNVWNNVPFEVQTEWFSTGALCVSAGILLDNISALMLTVVCLISFLVHLYSIGYMAGDDGEKRYFGMLGLFTFSMLGIILADNLILIFVFWELVGFSSYMLIGHWKEKPEAASAAKKAFVVNRIGDAGFLVGLMILWTLGAGFEISDLQAQQTSLYTFAGICIFCGVIGKSAQFPLSTWLPDAMEGPTPVSALIHAATMVAAGVYLLARVFNLFTPDALMVIALVGIVTSLMAAMSALVQNDIKKILAYSTISQLGLMVVAVGAGSWEAAMLHLFTHAFFKACLFLCAGSIIHVIHHAQHRSHLHFDVQDVRNLGGLRKKLPFTFLAVLISGSALAGIPFFSGFISKEAIFNAISFWAQSGDNAIRWFVLVAAFFVSVLTMLYIVRFIFLVFFGEEKLTASLSLAEAPKIMRAPIALLAAASIWLIISFNPLSSQGYFFNVNAPHSSGLTIFSIFWIGGALVLAVFLFSRKMWFDSELLYQSFYLNQIQNILFTRPTVRIASATMRVDRKWIDGGIHVLAYVYVTISHLAGWCDRALIDGTVNGIASFSRLIGSFTRSFQSGKIQLYLFWSIFAIVIFLIWSLI